MFFTSAMLFVFLKRVQSNHCYVSVSFLVNRVKVLQPEIFIEPLPKFVVKAFLQRQLKEMPSVNLGLLDSALVEALFPFQKEAVR